MKFLRQDSLPFDWTITSNDEIEEVCPADSVILGSFAVINILAGALSLVLGNRKVVQKLTCGLFGKLESNGWQYLWLLSLGLHLGANAIVARLMQATPGYLSTFSVGEMVLFFTTRPRLGWVFLIFTQMSMLTSFEYKSCAPDNDDDLAMRNDWWSSALSTVYAEVVLQTIALYPMAQVAAYGAPLGYLNVWTAEYQSLPSSARLMYGGALFYLTVGGMCLALLFWGFFTGIMTRSSDYCSGCRRVHRGRDPLHSVNSYVLWLAIVVLPIVTWMSSWLFWAGFVKLAGERLVRRSNTSRYMS